MAEEKSKIEELEEKLANLQKDRAKAEEEQFEKDLEARIELETEHDGVSAVRVKFKPGFPTRAYLRTPTDAEYRRYFAGLQKHGRAKNDEGTRKAQEQLAKAVWVYPKTQEEKDAMLAAFPGLLGSIGVVADQVASGKAEDEGKD